MLGAPQSRVGFTGFDSSPSDEIFMIGKQLE
jgi:hypothetical protein